ncbi:MAG: twitching motility protein, twitching motility protein PilT [Candidatus Woesebacteria bacterium GW2011_GWF1_31_35]|uniref:Twitching motility protein n=1 Tax=Candidatus Woesebacteria bacterium GW2011_GWC2_31_9 TaxID=1618586 RepID=A0A0F9YJJ6_9BACT|nr:MAG: twitching motility protein, twitching motility protein PilT [Candidatus Woesebacteria bacterium GW2011_GWF1_31_35]KKP22727.1 MAG: Twitching motility protein [Candidatus Woesebacteria bacterium GW2011_GWC1_30_29]KKP25890.1 MAG: Twitching motility protein [Candidatus Woesebacteria bacterium GW2011_GWD1_31_12]KKP27117.1 MAG: Twitching motility protein [Candidatus Woesebacteria bacterium GW2011_GWB1_31_29]KKP31483.1 MAG: Twitching motility protein [Candidatus Woesebacteria bacterium GW2011_
MAIDINNLLQQTVDLKASDLHLVAGVPPTLRIDGELKSVPSSGILTPQIISDGLKIILTSEQFERLSVNKEIDFSLTFSDKARFRVNTYTQKGSFAAAFRRIPLEIPDIDSLGLPKIVHSFTNLRQGLILVTGPTGHGKSTTLAATINEINKNRSCHIVTIEDPVEFVFPPIKSIISQREMRSDTHSWQVALRSVLREDPDVVLIGEMRDFETISSAMTIAETGHLVFATLHTNSAAQTVDRIVDVFPEDQQNQIRLQLSSILEAVFSQRLISGLAGGRVVAHEIMLGTTAIKTAIREGKTHQIDSIIQTSQEVGMATLEHSLASLVKTGKISIETAEMWSVRPEELNRLVKGSI